MLDHLARNFIEKGSINDAVMLIRTCRTKNMYNTGMMFGEYFSTVFPEYVEILTETALCQFRCKQYEKCYLTYQKLLTLGNIPKNVAETMIFNQHFCIDHIIDNFNYYNPELIQKLCDNKPTRPFPLVTVTITSCKRFDLFQQTVNSFINCCLDIDRIDRWLCIDDNSSEEDRKKMKEKYPFIEFYFKTPKEKGHPQSMNIIKKKVKTPFIFHMEDDWKFYCRHDYISHCMDVLTQNKNIGQCLINKNYAETSADIRLVGGYHAITHSGRRYVVHEHAENKDAQKAFDEKYEHKPHCAYWPHFSFRPSLLKTNILTELGPFNETVSHFEMDYSYRYKSKGYISAFLEGIYCRHIGRLTSERGDSDKNNAYTLNDEAQLSGKEEKLIKQVDNIRTITMKTYVINLNRRPDRWAAIQESGQIDFLSYGRLSAVDGTEIIPTEQLQRIFDGNDFNMRQGMVGCALSHIKLCIELANSNHNMFCILEDDLEFVPNFQSKFAHLLSKLPKDWDMCYLGHHLWKQHRKPEYYDKEKMPELEKWGVKKSFEMSMGGTGGYLISRAGAIGLLEFINKHGMTNGIDTIQQKSADTLNIYYCKPHLIYSECWTGDNDPDTDIQHNFHSLTIPLSERLESEKVYYDNQNRTVQHIKERKEAEEFIKNKDSNDVMFYGGPGVKDLIPMSVHPCYSLNYQVLIVVPNPSEQIRGDKWFERLKKNGEYNINEALSRRELPKFNIVPIGDTFTHSVLDVAGVSYTPSPFAKIAGETFETCSLLTELTIKMPDEEMGEFFNDFFDMKKNTTYIQQWNNKTVFTNTKYNISFPHDDLPSLKEKYVSLFQSYRDVIKSKIPVVFIYITRWETMDINYYCHFMDVIEKYNPNVHMLVINGIEEKDQVPKKYKDKLYKAICPYKENYRNNEWFNEKTIYDQQVFATSLRNPVEDFLSTILL